MRGAICGLASLLPFKLFVLNNFGYGIIKQFQDTWFDGRYEATGKGYSQPDFQKIANAYDLEYRKIESLNDIKQDDLDNKDGIFFDVILHPNTLIEPKIDSGNSNSETGLFIKLTIFCFILIIFNRVFNEDY